MDRPRFTKGPWKAEINELGELWLIMSDGSHKVYFGDMEETCGMCHANADLAAASPEMYTALEAIGYYPALSPLDPISALDDMRRIARAALAKTRG